MRHAGYLIVSAGGDMRVIRRWPNNIRNDEVMFRLTVDVPEGWGTVRGSITVTMPEPPDETAVDLVETSASNAASSDAALGDGENFATGDEGPKDASTSSLGAPRLSTPAQDR